LLHSNVEISPSQVAKSSYRSVDPQTLHGNVHQVDRVRNGPTNSAAIATMFPLRLCEGKLLVAVTRERRYGPSRLRVNDDDDERENRSQGALPNISTTIGSVPLSRCKRVFSCSTISPTLVVDQSQQSAIGQYFRPSRDWSIRDRP